MSKENKIKITLGIIYILVISIFLWFFFKYFSISDFTSYELIKSNRDILNSLKDNNIILSVLFFYIFTVIWVLLLGFGTPIFLIGGFIFGKWIGTLVVVFGLSTGATLLYLFAKYILKDFIHEKFSRKFNFLVNKFKKNEFLYFVVYRAIGGIPFFLQNLLPTIFNISLKNYFFGSLIGLAPQLFVGVSLGAGIDKVLDQNNKMPTITEALMTPDIYIPILALLIIFLITLIFRKKFFKN